MDMGKKLLYVEHLADSLESTEDVATIHKLIIYDNLQLWMKFSTVIILQQTKEPLKASIFATALPQGFGM